MLRSTFTFSARTASAAIETGASMAIRVSSWVRWLCSMSRTTPAPS